MNKKSSKPKLEEEIDKEDKDFKDTEEIIGPYTRIIQIEHIVGERVFIQKLTVPRRRPYRNIYQFKCTLLGTNPPVWRRIQVPENYTFYDLHVAIQDVMGWVDYHLHNFEIPILGKKGSRIHIECPWWDPWDIEEDWLITTEVPLKEYCRVDIITSFRFNVPHRTLRADFPHRALQ